ncbi:MAG: DUF2752 domain-containing protein [Bacteroidota bacterium]|nr:DUF2752 domain-containing protein [Bacteroidota bacterium]
MKEFIQWFKDHHVPCLFKETFGYDCPGCGGQSAWVLLLEGKFIESFYTYPPLGFVIVLLLFFFVHITVDIRKGDIILRWIFRLTAFVVLLSYVFKMTF